MTAICLICLKNQDNLINILGRNICNKDILDKLTDCVPEVEWNLYFKICNYCKRELNKLYNFKKLCIKSYESFKNTLWTKKLDVRENIQDVENISSDTESNALENDLEFSENEQSINDISFQCFNCSNIFDSKSKLENHIKETHITKEVNQKSEKKFPCKICGKTYTTLKGLQRHLKTCKKKTRECDKKDENLRAHRDKSEENIGSHITNVIKNEEGDIKVAPICSACGTTFCNKYLLKRHLQNVHATEKKFKCDLCERTFASLVYLNAHKRYHVGDRCHICSFCGKGFITASDLYHHEKIHANKRAYRCEICPKAFNTSSDLHKHKICVHLDRSEWKYVCSYCQRRFPLKTNLDTHVKTHTGEKNFPCHLCDRRCINKSVLLRHIETHSNVLAFKCDLCIQGYKYRKSLDIHLAKIHGIGQITIPERIKKFFCHLCPKSYFANNKLQKHIRSHNGERPFQCSNCNKSFVDKSYIKQHLKVAHNIVSVNKFGF